MERPNWHVWVNGEFRADTKPGARGEPTVSQLLKKLCEVLIDPTGRPRQAFKEKLKPMAGDDWGKARRWRGGQLRALYHCHEHRDGGQSHFYLVVHCFFKRTETAYVENRRYVDRYLALWDKRDAGPFVGQIGEAHSYYRFDSLSSCITGEFQADPDRVDYFELSDDQCSVVDGIFPLNRPSSQASWVRLVEGPPGSGKTVVAANALVKALTESVACDVLVLVPTITLSDRYRKHLESWGREEGLDGHFSLRDARFVDECDEIVPDSNPRVWVETLDKFFMRERDEFESGGIAVTEHHVREELLKIWTTKLWPMLEKSAMEWFKRLHPQMNHKDLKVSDSSAPSTRRLMELLSGTCGDGIEVPADAKDGLQGQDAPLCALRDIIWLKHRATFEKDTQRVRLRWQSTKGYTERLRDSCPGRQLLILVDEVQDLVPSEWQTLLTGVAQRVGLHRSDPDSAGASGIALLGDENQRIGPTYFSWGWVKKWFVEHQKARVETVALAGSFRTPQAVAYIANQVMRDKAFSPGDAPKLKLKHAEVINMELVKDQPLGRVFTYQCRDGNGWASDLIEAAKAADGQSGQLIVLAESGEPVKSGATESLGHVVRLPPELDEKLVCHPIKMAKGNEWDKVVVAGLFPEGRGDYDERCRAYTRLTRARRNLLLMIRSAGTNEHLDAKAHGPLVKVVEQLRIDRPDLAKVIEEVPEGDVARLSSILGEHFFAVQTLEQLVVTLRSRLDEEMKETTLSAETVRLAVQVVQAGGCSQLPQVFDSFLDARRDWISVLTPEQQHAPLEVFTRLLILGATPDAHIIADERLGGVTCVELFPDDFRHDGPAARQMLELRRLFADEPLESALGRFCWESAVTLLAGDHVTGPVDTPMSWVSHHGLVTSRWKKALEAQVDEFSRSAKRQLEQAYLEKPRRLLVLISEAYPAGRSEFVQREVGALDSFKF